MARVVSRKLIDRITANPYVPPPGATPEGIRRAEELECTHVQDKKVSDGSRPPSLEGYCKVFDKRSKGVPCKRYMNETSGEGKGLRNAEYLISLIMDHDGHSSSVMPEWRIIRKKEVKAKKRASPEPSSDESCDTDVDIDLDDPDKYVASLQLALITVHPLQPILKRPVSFSVSCILIILSLFIFPRRLLNSLYMPMRSFTSCCLTACA